MSERAGKFGSMLSYALTIFLGAFLLFQVQPLIGKYILPWFGGGPGVWTTCMLFFQILLLGGYAYAHLLSQKLKPRAQAVVHLILLLAAVALLPITPADSWKPAGDVNPVLQILLLLLVCLGLPYFVLSSTGPLMQQWFSRTNPGVSPYRLYALSNVGSLLALVSYPFYFETHLTRVAQARLWAAGLIAFAIFCGWCAIKLWRMNPGESATGAASQADASPADAPVATKPSRMDRALWLLLPACASVLLLATTNKLCQDVAVIPFLWVLPLALYLLSFVICFDSPRWYMRGPFVLALVASMVALCWVLFKGVDVPIRLQVAIYCGTLFICCMVCHGELYRLRPDPRQLTGFYLMIAAGGALGGLFVASIAPMIFSDYYELHLGLVLCAGLFVVVCAVTKSGDIELPRWLGCALTFVVFVAANIALYKWSKRIPNVGKFSAWGWYPVLWSLLPVALVYWFDRKPWRWLGWVLTLASYGALELMFLWLAKKYPAELSGKLLAIHIGLGVLFISLLGYLLVWDIFKQFRFWRLVACVWLSIGVLSLAQVLRMQAREDDKGVISKSRNFYGTLKVCEYRKDEPDAHYFLLQHGRITHGIQFVDPSCAMMPTSYYSRGSGIELAVRSLPKTGRRLGVVGLGTGSMAVHAREGDYLRFYEINQEVQRLATSQFTYLSNCAGKVEVAMGDARLSMERESPQNFDLLALDAFSSDAIPVHLLTKEAFALYDRHMRTNGIIAVHISNRYLDLEPVIVNIAREAKYQLASISFEETGDDEYDEGSEWWNYSSTWILLSHGNAIIGADDIVNAASTLKTNAVTIPLWTDDFASVFQILQ